MWVSDGIILEIFSGLLPARASGAIIEDTESFSEFGRSPVLGGRFGYFFFFCSGEGRGGLRWPGRGRGSSLWKIPGGESPRQEGGGGEGPGGCLWGIWGGRG